MNVIMLLTRIGEAKQAALGRMKNPENMKGDGRMVL
jgi:hypothetical protein